MAARIQGFPDTWKIDEVLRNTNAYKTMANAFPPPVARAMGVAIREALEPSLAIDHGRAAEEDAALTRTPGTWRLLQPPEAAKYFTSLRLRHTYVGRPCAVEFGRATSSTLHPAQ